MRRYLQHKVIPAEGRVLGLWSHVDQVEAPDVRGNANVSDGVAEYARAARLAELLVLVVEVLRRAHVPHDREVVAGAQLRGGEDDAVEGDVVFSEEIVQLDVVRVLPPLGPVVAQQGLRDREVPDGCIEPHVKHLQQGVLAEVRHIMASTLEEKLANGTGVPHFRSRVMHRFSRPPFSQLRTIAMAFGDQCPLGSVNRPSTSFSTSG